MAPSKHHNPSPEPDSDEESLALKDSELEKKLSSLKQQSKRKKGKVVPVIEDEESEDETYVVEDILARRTNKRTKVLEYLVKWEGWDNDNDNTWEPEENFDDPSLVREFNAIYYPVPVPAVPKKRTANTQIAKKITPPKRRKTMPANLADAFEFNPSDDEQEKNIPKTAPLILRKSKQPTAKAATANASPVEKHRSANRTAMQIIGEKEIIPAKIYAKPNWEPYLFKIKNISSIPDMPDTVIPGEKYKHLQVQVQWDESVELMSKSDTCYVKMETALTKFGRMLNMFLLEKVQLPATKK
ncbi:hypothetical protein HDU98_012306 [Podochytrium sp. JEL0797]|nr:hypothetical protein HDU98_012306 [Podochytrium sp. JEL0797]